MENLTEAPARRIEGAILLLRGQRVILDFELAALYGVSVKRLNEQVRRNTARFPPDFMFQLDSQEVAALRSHSATLKSGRGEHRKHPYQAFTEHGAIMAAAVLSSTRAVEMSVLVVRVFVKLRDLLSTHRVLATKLDELERKLATHDSQIVALVDAIRELMAPPVKPSRRIGFGR